MDITLLAIDIAKNVLQLHGNDENGKKVMGKKLARSKMLEHTANMPKCTISMEACGGANYWARQFIKQGHEVKLVSPQYVKPFVKGNKNDANDAEAIAEAASRPQMRFVPHKSVEQQDIQCALRIRERVVKQRTELSNQIRGLLIEYGITIRKGYAAAVARIPEILEDAENELSIRCRAYIDELYSELLEAISKVKYWDNEVEQIFKSSEEAQRIAKIPGIGPITAVAILTIGDLKAFKNGRHFAAYLGLVPKQHSSGGKERLSGISKRGNRTLRTLLTHGARTVLRYVEQHDDPRSEWIKSVKERRGYNKASCALANKTARVIWAMLTKGEAYKPSVKIEAVEVSTELMAA